MEKAKQVAMEAEFPFLKRFEEWKAMSFEIKVQRVDENTLKIRVPHFKPIKPIFLEEILGDTFFCGCIMFFDKGKKEIESSSVGYSYTTKKFILWGAPTIHRKFSSKETVGERLEKIGTLANDVYYIVVWNPVNRVIVIYKAPKGYSVGSWIQHMIEQAKVSLSKEIMKIDKV